MDRWIVGKENGAAWLAQGHDAINPTLQFSI